MSGISSRFIGFVRCRGVSSPARGNKDDFTLPEEKPYSKGVGKRALKSRDIAKIQ
jgi:hypothetical protein